MSDLKPLWIDNNPNVTADPSNNEYNLIEDIGCLREQIEELEAALEQQRWANEMLNAANIDIRKKCAELEIKLSQVLAVISGGYDDTYCPHGAEWGTCERCPRGEIE